MSIAADKIIEKCDALARIIEANEDVIKQLLIHSESYETIEDEIFKSVDCLRNIHLEIEDLTAYTVGQIASLLPVNLPMYSLIIFGVIPSFMADRTMVRPPQAMHHVIRQLYDLLDIGSLFPDILLLETIERDNFTHNIAAKSDVVLFTGSHRSALKVRAALPKETLFVYNGAGLNPIVVFEDADLDVAVEKTLQVKLFNSGQDCAGPDTILVHEKVVTAFMKKLNDGLDKVEVSTTYENGSRVGPLLESTYFPELGKLLLENQDNIVRGGNINYSTKVVEPTVILKDLAEGTNYAEIFAPLFYISTFDEDSFMSYFKSDHYTNYAMYVSVFGTSNLVGHIPRSVILHNQHIIEVERGNRAYGGYGLYGSYVICMGRMNIGPILISREIRKAFATPKNNTNKLSSLA